MPCQKSSAKKWLQNLGQYAVKVNLDFFEFLSLQRNSPGSFLVHRKSQLDDHESVHSKCSGESFSTSSWTSSSSASSESLESLPDDLEIQNEAQLLIFIGMNATGHVAMDKG